MPLTRNTTSIRLLHVSLLHCHLSNAVTAAVPQTLISFAHGNRIVLKPTIIGNNFCPPHVSQHSQQSFFAYYYASILIPALTQRYFNEAI